MTYRNHHRIEDLYMDLLPWSFVRAILDKEGKDINMEDQIKNYKQIIIEARAFIGAKRTQHSSPWYVVSDWEQKGHSALHE